MKIYCAERNKYGTSVLVREETGGYILDPRKSLELAKHSPTGFEWGYAGSGPAQLALAILLDLTGDEDKALDLYQRFKFDVIARQPKDGWFLQEDVIRRWLKDNHREAQN